MASTETVETPAGPGTRARFGLVVVVLLPIVVAVVRSIRNDWFPIGDDALLYIRAVDVFTEHHPLLGSWTSASLSFGEDVNNPGALYDYVIAPFAKVLPPGPGAAIGVGAVNAASVVGISMASRKVGGWAMQRWMLLAAAALVWTLGSELLIDIWQPHALLLPFLLLLVLLTGCAAGRAGLVPVTAAVASLIVQTHIGYAYIFVMLLAAVIGALVWLHRPIDWRRVVDAWRTRTFGITAAVLVVLWIQPLYEQFFGEGRGNMTRLLTNSSGGSFTLGPVDGTKIAGSIMALPWWWTRAEFVDAVPITRLDQTDGGPSLDIAGLPNLFLAATMLLLVTIGLALLTCAARRCGTAEHVAAGVIATVSVPATTISLSLLTVGPVGLSPHQFRWIWPLAIFVTFVAVWIAVDLWLASRSESSERVVDAIAIALVAVVSVVAVPYFAHPVGPVTFYDSMPAIRQAFPDIGVLDGHDPVLYDTSTVLPFEPYSATMMMRMQELGIEFRVDDEGMVRQLGNARRADGTEPTTVFQLQGDPALVYDGPACPIAAGSALSPDESSAAANDTAALADGLTIGTVRVDDARLPPDAPFELLEAARNGDLQAARQLVVDGTLPQWIRDGAADTTSIEITEPQLDRINTWSYTYFALFADPCPVDR